MVLVWKKCFFNNLAEVNIYILPIDFPSWVNWKNTSFLSFFMTIFFLIYVTILLSFFFTLCANSLCFFLLIYSFISTSCFPFTSVSFSSFFSPFLIVFVLILFPLSCTAILYFFFFRVVLYIFLNYLTFSNLLSNLLYLYLPFLFNYLSHSYC